MFSTVLKAIKSKLRQESGEVNDIKNNLSILKQRNKSLSQQLSAINEYMTQLEQTVSKHKKTYFAKQNEFETVYKYWNHNMEEKTASASFVSKCQIGLSKRLQHP